MVAEANEVLANLSEEDQRRLERINILLEEEVRPYLQHDGGDLHVLALEGMFYVFITTGRAEPVPAQFREHYAELSSF